MRQAGGHWLRFHRFRLAAAIWLAVGNVLHAQRLIHVDASAVGASNGRSWTDAYADLQDALDDVREVGGCPCEIWVAAGTYYPDRGTGDPLLAFEVPDNVSIFGGFGGREECRDERDWIANETVLSGDLNGDDEPNYDTGNSCCRNFGPCEDAECRAKVVTFEPRCNIFWLEQCPYIAYELCCDVCRPSSRCENSQNVVRIVEDEARVVLDGLTVAHGEATRMATVDDRGGGVYVVSTSAQTTVRHCKFAENVGATGMAIATSSVIEVEGSDFEENYSISSPGDPFSAIPLASGHAIFGGFFIDHVGLTMIRQSRFVHNRGGGVYVRRSGEISDSLFIENTGASAVTVGGPSPSMTVTRCRFIGNTGALSGSALYNNSGSPIVKDCVFLGNSARSEGGAITSNGSMRLTNCVFALNKSSFAGALVVGLGSAIMTNCAVVHNESTDGPGGIYAESIRIRNSIIWDNRLNDGIIDVPFQISYFNRPIIDYSIIQGWTGNLGGVGNSGVDPLFVDPNGEDDIAGTEDDDLRLSPDSPAINAGDPNLAGLPINDLDGHFRVLCGAVDIGAYEFGIGDFTCDRKVGPLDAAELPSCLNGPEAGFYDFGCEAFDFDADADVDLRDAASFLLILE